MRISTGFAWSQRAVSEASGSGKPRAGTGDPSVWESGGTRPARSGSSWYRSLRVSGLWSKDCLERSDGPKLRMEGLLSAFLEGESKLKIGLTNSSYKRYMGHCKVGRAGSS